MCVCVYVCGGGGGGVVGLANNRFLLWLRGIYITHLRGVA